MDFPAHPILLPCNRPANGTCLIGQDVPPGREAHAARIERATEWLQLASGRDDIHVVRRASGRPVLAPPHSELGTSMATSGGWLAVVADISAGACIGVDIEFEDPSLDPYTFARDHYAPAERAAVASLPEAAARRHVFRLWVAKEALLKLTGRGVFDGLDAPDLSALGDDFGGSSGVAIPASAQVPAARLVVGSYPGVGPTDLQFAVASAL
ncbi:MAG: 4'-phosphopantetheinyl transferase superfamily protein [Hyphomicrobiaceae bacterium]